MDNLVFEWDKQKATSNAKKHGVTFDEAKNVFFDEFAIHYFVPDHCAEENRFILLRLSHTLNTIVICHCFREQDTTVRIISSRKADKLEPTFIGIIDHERLLRLFENEGTKAPLYEILVTTNNDAP